MKSPKAPAVPKAGLSDPRPPRTIVQATRLMYGGAALALVYAAVLVIVIAGAMAKLRAQHPHATTAQLQATQGALITLAIISGLIEAVLWVLMARLNRAGAKWARIAASVLLAANTWNLITQLTSGAAAVSVGDTALSWLIGAGAILLLWQRDSAAYYA